MIDESNYIGLFDALASVTRTSAQLLEFRPDLSTLVEEASSGLSATLTCGFEIAHGAAIPGEWSDWVLAIRAIDRALALIGLLDKHLEERLKLFPFAHQVCDGARMLWDEISAGVRRLPRSFRGAGGGLYGSGTLAEISKSAGLGSISIYSPDVPPVGLKKLISGVASDALDLLELDISQRPGADPYFMSQTRNLISLRTAWLPTIASSGLSPSSRSNWPCGTLFSASDFASRLGVSQPALRRLVRQRSVLGLRSWNGEHLFPEIQLGSNGKPYANLTLLLNLVDLDRISIWSLVLWLGQSHNASTNSRMQELDTQAGLQRVLSELSDAEALKPYSVPNSGTFNVPPQSVLAKLIPAGRSSSYAGASSKLNAAYTYGSGPSPRARLFRVTRRSFGAFYFSSSARSLGEGGRFDLPISDMGTCYMAKSVPGALDEVFSRVLVLDVQEVIGRTLWSLAPSEDIAPMLNLNDSQTLAPLQMNARSIYGRYRRDSQLLAERAHLVGFVGIEYPLYNGVGKKGTRPVGVALFGRSNDVGGTGGRGVWVTRPQSLLEAESFWRWLDASYASGNPSPSPMFSQLPLHLLASS